jgi:hypothetical protein
MPHELTGMDRMRRAPNARQAATGKHNQELAIAQGVQRQRVSRVYHPDARFGRLKYWWGLKPGFSRRL